MSTVKVDLSEGSYCIDISTGLLSDPSAWPDFLRYRQIVIITNTVVAKWYLQPLKSILPLSSTVLPIVIEDGEAQKSLTVLDNIVAKLLKNHIQRNALIVALGGGVIGDLAGFIAATYQRGIDFIQIPTTLLAMVDAAVGGKTAVNHALGKNMIGAFYQPKWVLIDPTVLQTLPQRQFTVAIAEILKYGLIADALFYQWIQTHLQQIKSRSNEDLSYVIQRCCEIKAAIVAQDETEQQGLRVILNYGHTFAHAIEQIVGYGKILHGEAVAIGMCLALELQVRRGELPETDLTALKTSLQQVGLPTELPLACDEKTMLAAMRRDKKNTSEQIKLVLLSHVGKAILVELPTSKIFAK